MNEYYAMHRVRSFLACIFNDFTARVDSTTENSTRALVVAYHLKTGVK